MPLSAVDIYISKNNVAHINNDAQAYRPLSAAFGALKGVFRNRHLDYRVKGRVYVAPVLGIFLPLRLRGVEPARGQDFYRRLRRFHSRCARTMCRIDIAHTIRHRAITKSPSEVAGCLYGRPRFRKSQGRREERNGGRPKHSRQSRGWLTSPSAFQQNTGTRKMTREWNICHALSSAGSRTPVEHQHHIHPRHPRVVVAMRCLLYEIWGVTT